LVIDENHSFNLYWRFLIFFLLLYNAIATPFRVSYHTTATSDGLFAWETFTDLVLFLDIVLTFFTPYARNDGSFERSNVKIARNYMRNYLMIDIIVVFPTQFLEIHYNHHDTPYHKIMIV